MANDYYSDSGYPSTGAAPASAPMRAELASVSDGFDKLPTLTGNGGKIIAVNAGGTAQEALTTTGTGSAVRATSPTLVTPMLGTPSSGVTDNLTTTTTTDAITNTDFVDTNLAAGGKRKILWTAVKTYLKAYFDTLYPSGSGTSSGTNTGDQTITLTGAVTGSGTGSFATSLGSFTVAQLNTAISDADVATGGGTATGTNTGDQTLPTRASLGLDTTDSPQFAGVNLGHASDTTLSRVSAGVVAIEGSNLVTAASLAGGTLPASVTTLSARKATAGDVATFTNGGASNKTAYVYSDGQYLGWQDAGSIGGTGLLIDAITKLVMLRVNNGSVAEASTTGLAVIGTLSATTGAAVGGATPGTGGLAFPATAVAVADPNTLDDYEEGTWTPSVGGDATYTLQEGFYRKCGQIVTVIGKLIVGTIGTGSTSIISGLPFSSIAPPNGSTASGSFSYFSNLASSVVSAVPAVVNNSSTISITALSAAATTATVQAALIGSGTRLDISVTYIASA